MTLRAFRAENFRCLPSVALTPDPRLNLLCGPNGSGKTSVLEAIYFLGRGRSFRSARPREVIRYGAGVSTLFAEATDGDRLHRAGVELRSDGRSLRLDGSPSDAGHLAALLPVQCIDPEIHQLIQGPPEVRRRFLDWGVFHVEHGFLVHWRRYQKALRQRNAALRTGASIEAVSAWDGELFEQGMVVDQARRAYIERALPQISSILAENMELEVNCSYLSGWSANVSLAESLTAGLLRDRAMGSTQAGPHRADLKIEVTGGRARHRVSRGQQKMLGACLIIAQTRLAIESQSDRVILLVDDPAAELDRNNRERLFALLTGLNAQLFVTALERGDLPWQKAGRAWTVEHSEVVPLI